ncbi:hypothetical protein COY87_02010 [Candidatus Roizmanbacteria bacterium CG_4_10_14_0_8_um_filter_33_9]|uniref:Transcobalamin-like C-terminal domain-containing protein n=1 Tax=Candidatus Roizmanbacteria bacterium CG_4_10_14_0_8_um_filter_33_9 TaxID=1974826 RepID=A0A2M7QIR2_9BACT|nr:MAG: hypothetical protein COY87_02010 [Candidatus Roizmanbacteria bacterium CG_4_10_14_0_8_um_filter_33_9]
MKKNILIIFLTFCVIYFLGYAIANNKVNLPIEKQQQFTVSQKISTKEFTKTYNKIKVIDEMTALQLLQKTTKVIIKGEGQNAFVVSINGKDVNNKQNEYWSFEINGKESQVGAGSYILKPQDIITWTIKKF